VSNDRSISKRRFATVNWGMFALVQACIVLGLALNEPTIGFIALVVQGSFSAGLLVQKCWIERGTSS